MNNKQTFEEQGFLIFPNWFDELDLSKFESIVWAFYLLQAKKIKPYSHLLDIRAILEAMEKDDAEALYQVQKFLPSSQYLRSILRPATQFLTDLLCTRAETNLLDGPGFLINRPNTGRLLYKWHSEEHYYPKRRRFINIWFPLFEDKTIANGTMSIKVGSHKKVYPFSEYHPGKNQFIQYEVPENFHSEFEEVHCESKRGDLVVFHSNLIHRSNVNTSSAYSFAGVARIWNPSHDLTLSGNLCATPYGGDVGRQEIIVSE